MNNINRNKLNPTQTTTTAALTTISASSINTTNKSPFINNNINNSSTINKIKQQQNLSPTSTSSLLNINKTINSISSPIVNTPLNPFKMLASTTSATASQSSSTASSGNSNSTTAI